MEQRKIRILSIAPYKGLLNLIEKVAGKRDDIEMTTIFGNLDQGAEIASAIGSDYDIIMSRARTAELIYRATHMPVIDIGMTYYDMLRSIRQAEISKAKFAIVGFKDLMKVADSVCKLMQYDIPVFLLNNSSDIEPTLNNIAEMGIHVIICDTQPYDLAKSKGITPLLLTSGAESIEDAIERSVKMYESIKIQADRLATCRRIIESSDNISIVLDMNGNPLYPYSLAPDVSTLVDALKDNLYEIDHSQESSYFLTINSEMYEVTSRYYNDFFSPYVVFHVKKNNIPMSYSKNGITILNKTIASHNFNESFYSYTKLSTEMLSVIKKFNSASDNVMIVGEVGTGKDRVAQMLYAESTYSHHPLYMINCSLINNRSWSFITGNYNSPITDNGNTIYLSNLNALDEAKQKQLLSIITDTNLSKRNRLIMSYAIGPDNQIPHFAMRFINQIGCSVLNIPALRTQPEDISASASLYLNSINQQTAHQVVGFEDDAAEYLRTYNWPYNRAQFKRVLKAIVSQTVTPYITLSVVKSVIEAEGKFAGHQDTHAEKKATILMDDSSEIDLSKTLSDIDKDIVLKVLERCHGNQSAAAKSLGISRTTLWRYCK